MWVYVNPSVNPGVASCRHDTVLALTIANQLHGNDSAAGHEAGECTIEGLPLMHCIELLRLPERQPTHLHFTALHRHLLERSLGASKENEQVSCSSCSLSLLSDCKEEGRPMSTYNFSMPICYGDHLYNFITSSAYQQ